MTSKDVRMWSPINTFCKIFAYLRDSCWLSLQSFGMCKSFISALSRKTEMGNGKQRRHRWAIKTLSDSVELFQLKFYPQWSMNDNKLCLVNNFIKISLSKKCSRKKEQATKKQLFGIKMLVCPAVVVICES